MQNLSFLLPKSTIGEDGTSEDARASGDVGSRFDQWTQFKLLPFQKGGGFALAKTEGSELAESLSIAPNIQFKVKSMKNLNFLLTNGTIGGDGIRAWQ